MSKEDFNKTIESLSLETLNIILQQRNCNESLKYQLINITGDFFDRLKECVRIKREFTSSFKKRLLTNIMLGTSIIENNINKNQYKLILQGLSMVIGRINSEIINEIKDNEHNKLSIFINSFKKEYSISKECYRCGGTGILPQFSHYMDGVCFLCGGEKNIDLSTLEDLEIDDYFDDNDWENFDFSKYDD